MAQRSPNQGYDMRSSAHAAERIAAETAAQQGAQQRTRRRGDCQHCSANEEERAQPSSSWRGGGGLRLAALFAAAASGGALLMLSEARREAAEQDLAELRVRHERLRSSYSAERQGPAGLGGAAVSPMGGCVAWRATASCSPPTRRLFAADLPCDAEIPAVAPGLCECTAPVGWVKGPACGGAAGGPITCAAVCAERLAAVTGRRAHYSEQMRRVHGLSAAAVAAEGVPLPAAAVKDVPLSSTVGSDRRQAAPPAGAGCTAWRQTAGCDPQGPREAHNDRGCEVAIPEGMSGYCECAGQRRAAQSGCGARATVVCAAVCAAAVSAAAAAVAAAPAAEAGGTAPAAGAAGAEGGAALPPPDGGGTPVCVAWRQTAECDPRGRREEGNDRTCSDEIPSGASGYCLCRTGTKQWRVPSSCDPRPNWICREVCRSRGQPQRPPFRLGDLQRFEASLDAAPAAAAGAGAAPAAKMLTVPLVMHQTWASRDSLPKHLLQYTTAWLRKNPDWRYEFWDDKRLAGIMAKYFPSYVGVFDAMRPIHQADVGRAAVLYVHGGAYADLDMEPLKSLTPLTQAAAGSGVGVLLAEENMLNAVLLEGRTAEESLASNFMMLSQPRHPLWLCYLRRAFKAFAEAGECDPVTCTGPRMLDQIVRSPDAFCRQQEKALGAPSGSVLRLPWRYFSAEPAFWNLHQLRAGCTTMQQAGVEEACRLLEMVASNVAALRTNRSYAVHHWQCSWCREDAALQSTEPLAAAVGRAGRSLVVVGDRATAAAPRPAP
eukprot:TRINITY_DN24316_c0_g1_i1.p1 TRINITY_DN24316_c0_g1~~TRINITY_DN24316_c0_g1_i1.p1  ORF type:complete len:794 (+),score=195.28 TRINITY_DN24316_c0_g1_i1:65-2383(+)